MSNKTQKKIFPYMLLYFALKLTTIGFEKQYEKYKNNNIHRKTWAAVFVGTFFYFFYFTISYKRIFNNPIKNDENEEEEEEENEYEKLENQTMEKQLISKLFKKESMSMLTNEILTGTIGILMFNGVFSLIFSILYL